MGAKPLILRMFGNRTKHFSPNYGSSLVAMADRKHGFRPSLGQVHFLAAPAHGARAKRRRQLIPTAPPRRAIFFDRRKRMPAVGFAAREPDAVGVAPSAAWSGRGRCSRIASF